MVTKVAGYRLGMKGSEVPAECSLAGGRIRGGTFPDLPLVCTAARIPLAFPIEWVGFDFCDKSVCEIQLVLDSDGGYQPEVGASRAAFLKEREDRLDVVWRALSEKYGSPDAVFGPTPSREGMMKRCLASGHGLGAGWGFGDQRPGLEGRIVLMSICKVEDRRLVYRLELKYVAEAQLAKHLETMRRQRDNF